MSPILFYVFAAVMLVFGVMVVALRNPVAGALSLVVSFLGLAALFVSLDAYFIGVIQVLVYAGAVMVLFLFIIMLLDLETETRRRTNWLATLGGLALVAGLVIQIVGILSSFEPGRTRLADVPIAFGEAAEIREREGRLDSITADLRDGRLPDVKLVGETVFTRYQFHLQVVGVLLLVSSIGVVVLSKKELR